MKTSQILERQSLTIGFDATFNVARNTGKICRSDSWSTWFKFADDSVICFDKLSDNNYEITACDE